MSNLNRMKYEGARQTLTDLQFTRSGPAESNDFSAWLKRPTRVTLPLFPIMGGLKVFLPVGICGTMSSDRKVQSQSSRNGPSIVDEKNKTSLEHTKQVCVTNTRVNYLDFAFL
jgi:hypothetical protein